VDSCEQEILRRFEARADEVADEIAACTLVEVPGFGPVNDKLLFAEIRALTRQHLDRCDADRPDTSASASSHSISPDADDTGHSDSGATTCWRSSYAPSQSWAV
jgi:hypothetical protein